MKALIISDMEYQTNVYSQINTLIKNYLTEKNYDITEMQIVKDELAFCTGCFKCWAKTPGQCIINDNMSEINRISMTSDTVIYLSPVMFGQFSANIKNTIDRWLPNVLPFFEAGPDDSTVHPPRYQSYPKNIIIGYGDELSKDDALLFSDITKKHRRDVDVLIYGSNEEIFAEEFSKLELTRVEGLL
jgi:multimeric flavodoxin WrbA